MIRYTSILCIVSYQVQTWQVSCTGIILIKGTKAFSNPHMIPPLYCNVVSEPLHNIYLAIETIYSYKIAKIIVLISSIYNKNRCFLG